MKNLVTGPVAASSTLRIRAGTRHEFDLAILRPASARVGVLWLPALGVPAAKYAGFAAALAADGVAIALHEMRGNASSNLRAGNDCDWGYAELLEDIVASREGLAETEPDIQWTIGGHSIGAQLAALGMAQSPERYAGLAIVGSGQPWWRTFSLPHRPFMLAALLGFRVAARVFGYFPGDRLGFAGREARGVMREWSRSGLRGRYQVERLAPDFESLLQRITAPVFAVGFTEDRYVPAQSLTHLLRKMPRAPLTRAAVSASEFARGRAGHFDWMRDPLPVVRRLAEWAGAISTSQFSRTADALAG
jgi:predicted alpha/beta hydrolase